MTRHRLVVLTQIVLLAMSPCLALAFADGGRAPTIDDLLTLKSAGGAQISPDGRWVAYTTTETDFKQDVYITQVWLVNAANGKSLQLTRGDKPSGNPQWSPDGEWLAFTSSRIADKNQIFIIRPDGGEAVQLTKAETAVTGYSWSEDGRSIAFTMTDAAPQAMKDRKEYFGDFEVVRRDYGYSHLWTIDVPEAMKSPAAGRQRTRNKDFSVGAFSWSPDGTKIAFSATVNPDLIQGVTSDIYVLNLTDDSIRKIVSQPGPDINPRWSPDGRQIVFSTAMGKTIYFANNSRLAVVAAEGGTPRSITDSFDENPSFVDWKANGLYFTGLQKTASLLLRVDPVTAKITRIGTADSLMAGSFSLTRDAGAWPTRQARPHRLMRYSSLKWIVFRRAR